MEIKFRPLRADEIECRINQCTEKFLTLLLYKDARADMKLLDETVGPENWQRSHELINGNLFCNVGIWVDRRGEGFGEWIWKQDVGTESNTEKEKGQASDSFKRACTNWGIGRELYTAPDIRLWADKGLYKLVVRNGKPATYDRFKVSEIEYTDGNITALQIRNTSSGKVVFDYSTGQNRDTEMETDLARKIGKTQIETLKKIAKPNQISYMLNYYKVEKLEDITNEQYAEFTRQLMKKEQHGEQGKTA